MTTPTRVNGRLDDMTGLTPIATTTMHADPQAVFRRLRAEWGEVAPIELAPGFNAWLVMGHEELSRVLRQQRLFAKDARHWSANIEGRLKPDSPLAPLMTPRRNAFFADGDEHRRLRAPLDEAVYSLRLRQVSRQVKEVCAALIADFAPRGRADLVAEYAQAVPTMALGRMFGLDVETSREMYRAQMDVIAVNENAIQSMARFEEIIGGPMRARQAEPADDMATVLARHPNHKDDEERFESMLVVISIASESTMAWVASTLQLMLTDERFSGRVRGGRLGIDDALDEVLWRETPLSTIPARYALRDTELGGQAIRRGDALYLGFAAANADPRVHSDDQWSELGNRSYLTWGAGPHACPAWAATRVIVRTAVEAALHRLPDVRLAVPGEEIERFPSPMARHPATLPVTFTPFDATST